MSTQQVQPLRQAGQISLLTEANLSATQELLQRCDGCKSTAQESGKPLMLRAQLTAADLAAVNSTLEALARKLSTPQTISGAVMAYSRMLNMPGKSLSEKEADHEISIWGEDLTNIDDAGIIPDEIMMRVAKAYSAGKHGAFRPSSGEFINRCKEYLRPFQRQRYDLKRFKEAVVEPKIERRSAATSVSLPNFQPMPVVRDPVAKAARVETDAERIRRVFEQTQAIEAARAERDEAHRSAAE